MAIKKIKNAYNNWEEHKDKINALIDGGGGGGGGNAVWGNIEGNIYAQSDLVAVLSNKANANSVYTKAQTDTLLDNKQNTLTAGDGIVITSNIISTNIINDTLASRTTVWSSQEVKDRFDAISGSARIIVVATMPATPEENTLYYVGTSSPYSIKLQSAGVLYDMGTTEIDLTGYYTKTEIDTLLSAKANSNNVYTKSESDTKYQEKITDSIITTVSDSDYISDVDANAKTNKRLTFSNLFNWIINKLTTAITSTSTNNQIPTAKSVYELVKTTTPTTHTDNIKNPRITYLNDKTIMLNCQLQIPYNDIRWNEWGSGLYFCQLNNYGSINLPTNVNKVIALNATNNRLTGLVCMQFTITNKALILTPFLVRGTNAFFDFEISISTILELT